MLYNMATILVCYGGHFVFKIQRSSDLGKIWFPNKYNSYVFLIPDSMLNKYNSYVFLIPDSMLNKYNSYVFDIESGIRNK